MNTRQQYDEPDNTTAASGWGCIVVIALCLAFWALAGAAVIWVLP